MKRNLLFITVDQWRGDCLGHLGHPGALTPNISRLAARGVTFRRHFAQGAPCAPSRMAMYASRYVFNHRVVTNATPIDPHLPTLPHYLRRLAYEPYISGYTSTTWSPEGRAARDPILGEPSIAPEWSVLRAFDGERRRYLEYLAAQGYGRFPRFGALFAGALQATAEGDIPASPIAEAHSETAWLTDAALDYIRYADGDPHRPWAVHLSYFKPHPPFLPSRRFAELGGDLPLPAPPKRLPDGAAAHDHPFSRYARAKRRAAYVWPGAEGLACDLTPAQVDRARRSYLALCAEVDFHIGRVLDTLEAIGAADSTLVVLCSDHAEMLGDHGLFGKESFFPESFHIPLIIADPDPAANATRGRVVSAFTEGVDILPTLWDWLDGGTPDAGWDGRSLLPYLRGPTDPAAKPHVVCDFDFRHDKEAGFVGAMAGLDPRRRNLSMILGEEGFYVRFAGLPDLCFVLDDVDALAYRPAVGAQADRIRAWGLAALLDHRMVHADNRRPALVASAMDPPSR